MIGGLFLSRWPLAWASAFGHGFALLGCLAALAVLPNVLIPANDVYVVAGTAAAFEGEYGFSADQYSGSINGNGWNADIPP